MKRALGAFIAVVLVAGTIAAGVTVLGGGDGPGAEEARLIVDGSAVVDHADGATTTVTDATTVAFGDTVTLESGTAALEYAGGARYELTADPAPTVIGVEAVPTLVSGRVLAADGFPASVLHDGATVTAQGPAQVDASGPMVSSYRGGVRLSGLGDLGEMRALRQVLLTPSASPEPLAYDGTDPWDRRYLGEAVAFGQRLEALARGYTNGLRQDSPGESFFEAVIPALAEEREFNQQLLDPGRAPGETLVGAAIAVQGRDGTFTERWQEIFAFRDAGAAWGLVALDQGVSAAPVLDTIELAITGPETTTTTTTAPGQEPSPTTTTDPGAPPTTTTTTTTTTTPPQDPDEPPPDEPGILDPVLGPTDEVLDEVLDTLGLG